MARPTPSLCVCPPGSTAAGAGADRRRRAARLPAGRACACVRARLRVLRRGAGGVAQEQKTASTRPEAAARSEAAAGPATSPLANITPPPHHNLGPASPCTRRPRGAAGGCCAREGLRAAHRPVLDPCWILADWVEGSSKGCRPGASWPGASWPGASWPAHLLALGRGPRAGQKEAGDQRREG